jgi:hypothetical protein
MKDEDIMFEQRRQAMIDSEAWNSAHSIPWHQKVGTTVPFSRMVDRDPNPRIPLSVPEDGYPVVGKGERLFGWATVVVIVVLAVWVW